MFVISIQSQESIPMQKGQFSMCLGLSTYLSHMKGSCASAFLLALAVVPTLCWRNRWFIQSTECSACISQEMLTYTLQYFPRQVWDFSICTSKFLDEGLQSEKMYEETRMNQPSFPKKRPFFQIQPTSFRESLFSVVLEQLGFSWQGLVRVNGCHLKKYTHFPA